MQQGEKVSSFIPLIEYFTRHDLLSSKQPADAGSGALSDKHLTVGTWCDGRALTCTFKH